MPGKIEQKKFFIAYIFLMQRGEKKTKKKKTLICSLFILSEGVVHSWLNPGAERCAESRRVAGRRSVTAPTVRI